MKKCFKIASRKFFSHFRYFAELPPNIDFDEE